MQLQIHIIHRILNFGKGNPTDMWSDEMKEAIPRAVFFSDRGNRVMIYGLETGIVWVFKTICIGFGTEALA